MIRLRIDDRSLHTVRLVFSPLWEAIGSLGILARYRGDAPSPYTRWARAVRKDMPPEVSEGLVEAVRRTRPPLLPPDFVSVPDPSRTTFAAELDHLREKKAGALRGERLVELLERYWECAVAPYWTAIRASLEEEILFRGRTLVVEGAEAMLAELGGRVLWSRPQLTAPYHKDLELAVARTRLLLVPTVFAGGVRLFVREPDVVAMSYQARATGLLHVSTARRPTPEAKDRLALLLGSGRTQVLRALEQPRTTTAVADTLGLAKSTVSQHLAVLTEVGIVWKQRIGGRVFYQLDRDCLALLEHLGL
jgi:DNA-binding transcriptional ArsR family regulator